MQRNVAPLDVAKLDAMTTKEAEVPFRTILTVTGPFLGNRDLELAATLCDSVDAHMSVLVVDPAPPLPMGEYGTVIVDGWMREREEDVRTLAARRDEVVSLLASLSVSADVTSEYPEIASCAQAIGRRARYADLTVLGADVLAADDFGECAIEGAVFSSGGPVMVLPRGGAPTLKPRCVAIAWDGRIEASKAVRAALGLLVQADDVRLVLVDPVEDERGHGAEPGADAATYLTRHGVKVTVDRLPSQGHSVADVLSRHARDCAADLMVMGAYGHSRLRERIFGGVTRSMLANPPLPLLLAR